MDSAAAVFIGEVVTSDQLVAILRVEKVWKGQLEKTVRMQLGTRTVDGLIQYNTCDYDFANGKTHLVFAEKAADGAMMARKCRFTAPIAAATDTVRILDDLVRGRRSK